MSRLLQVCGQKKSLLGPAIIIFVSANIANVANLAFNMIFARLMSPSEFADLTLLMSIKLGLLSIFSALQFGVSEIAAKKEVMNARSMAAKISRQSLLFSIPLCFVLILGAELIARVLNFQNLPALICLFLAIPFFLPMIIFRGLAQGQMHLPKMVGSFQAEWIVRLFGCWLMWMAGFGLMGITIALILSVFAGLIFTMDKDDIRALKTPDPSNFAILKTTLPYGLIFLAQVLALDGDIFIAKAAFSNEVAGGAAALLLIQRIFFFAFLSFATILQPFIVGQTTSEQLALKPLLKLLGIVVLVSGVALSIIAIRPELFVGIFLGANYVTLAPMVLIAGAIGASMVGVQLTVVAFLAKGGKQAPFILMALALIYYLGVMLMMSLDSELSYETLLKLKLLVFGTGILGISAYLGKRVTANP